MKLFDKVLIGAGVGIIVVWAGTRIKQVFDRSKKRADIREKMLAVVRRSFEVKDDPEALDGLYMQLIGTARELAKATPGGASIKERVVVDALSSCHLQAYKESRGGKGPSPQSETLFHFTATLVALDIVRKMRKEGDF